MTRQNTESMMGRGLTRRRMMALGMAGLAGWMLSPIRMAAAALQEDLDLVAHIPQMEKREGPLLVFRDFANDPDVEVEQHVRLQLSQRKDLLDRVRQKIGFENRVILSVEDIQVRLMFVPQRQEGHSAAYYRYCLDVTDALFEMNRMDSIYDAIISPKESFPTIPKTGISAFLVHRLAKEYKAICRFTAESGESVTYRITGAIFSNHLGAVDLEIQLLAPGQYGLTRKPYTIWQNDTENLYTLMSVPVEETLHFHLGKATDHQILASMQTDPPENLSAAQRLAQEWMAVEESVVGGLVYRVLASYCARHHMAVPGIGTGETHPAVPSLHQYRYRDRGIELVRNIGFRKAMAMYMDNPLEFRDQLLREDNA